jgi:[acyl-carrier-protein] S-malonyltransferase
MTRVGVVFPGQGSQVVGMGADVADRSPQARALFDRAAEILGYDLLELQRTGPEERLRETQFSQPAIFVTNLALATAVGDALQPVVSAGHSFGELCSLTLAGALDFDDALRVVDERGKAMQAAAEAAPGGMAAVLGLDAETIRTIVDEVRTRTGLRVQLANFNAPSQIVISGDLDGVRAASDELSARGAKRVVPLNVSGAWHSELMQPAVPRFARAVAAASLRLPRFDVVGNVDARAYRSPDEIRANLVRSITGEVRWHETAQRLLEYGLDLVVELGGSPVLGPLMKRMAGAPRVLSVCDADGVERLRAELERCSEGATA